LEITAARAAHLEPAIFAFRIRRGGHELLAALFAIDARVGRELPRAGAERAAERAMATHDFRERRPRSAGRTIPTVPGVERQLQVGAGVAGVAEERPLQRVDERTDGEV